MVASTHWLASSTGMAVLEAGGNAFDAAVAAGMVLHVVEPHLNGVGGDLPLIGCAAGGRPFVLCGQGTSPAAATPERFRHLGLDVIPGTGLLAAVVPGAFGTWLHLLDRYGTWYLADVLSFAIGYARRGFPLVPQASATIGSLAGLFREHWPSSAQTYLPDGVPAPMSRFANPALANTLERLVLHGHAAGPDRHAQIEAAYRGFYQGFVAEAIDAFCAREVMDATGAPHRGLLTADDLAAWRVREEAPVSLEFAGRRVYKTGPWGQGPVLLQQLAMLAGMNLADTEPGSGELVHAVVETAKLALADRDAWYGDPDRVEVPLEGLLAEPYLAQRRAMIDAQASDELRPGRPGGVPPRLPDVSTAHVTGHGLGEPTLGDTCHLDVVDAAGNIVSATPSGGWLQSSPTIPGLGFQLSTRAQMFWLEAGLPGTLAPSTRPRTTLSPTLIVGDGVIACGTPGGDNQDQWQVPFILNHLVYGMNLQEAIDAPNWHTTHHISSFEPRTFEPRGLHAESRLGESVLSGLRARGHQVNDAGPWALGRIRAVAHRDGLLYGAANPRGMQGYAVGR
jgi:gamma-glutamyltranspeptidase / glutathione hydrolase